MTNLTQSPALIIVALVVVGVILILYTIFSGTSKDIKSNIPAEMKEDKKREVTWSLGDAVKFGFGFGMGMFLWILFSFILLCFITLFFFSHTIGVPTTTTSTSQFGI